MLRATLLSAVAAIFLLAGCAKPAFTEAVRVRYGFTDAELKRLQFYTSDKIVLRREVIEQKRAASENALAIRDEVRIQEVVIPAGTPGVAIRVEGDAILVSFSREHPNRALWFGLKKRADGESTEPLRYELLPIEVGAETSGDDNPRYAKGFLVTYGSEKYHVADGKMWSVHLLYELDEKFADNVVREKAPGWRLSEGTSRPGDRPTKSQSASQGGDATRHED